MKRADRKMAELILYISVRSEGDEHFGATKLNKILFYADFIHYGKTGESITGQTYQRLEMGPAPRRLLPIRRELQETEDLVIQRRDRFGRIQERTVALREPDLTIFTGEEIKLVDDVIDALWEGRAIDVSLLSHDFAGWKLVRDRQTIPYESVFLTDRPLTAAERAYARELVGHGQEAP